MASSPPAASSVPITIGRNTNNTFWIHWTKLMPEDDKSETSSSNKQQLQVGAIKRPMY